MFYDLATWTLLALMIWAGIAILIVRGAKPTPTLVVKNPVGFMPPSA